METIKLPLMHGPGNEIKLLDVSGTRMLRGFADTGVFKIVSIGEQLATMAPKTVTRGDDGLAFATIRTDGPLELADRDRGSDPYNRLGRRMR